MGADDQPTRGPTTGRTARRAAAVVLVCAAAALPSRAEVVEYSWVVHDRQHVSYEVPIEVRHAGAIVVDASWDGGRILAFRLEGPDDVRMRRSGPSPQRLEAAVGPREDGAPARFVLFISGLPAGGDGDGVLRVEVPDPPAVVAAREAAALPPPPPAPRPEPWMVASSPSAGLSPDREVFHREVERLREAIVDESDWTLGVDPCRWREGALRYLVDLRDGVAAGGPPPEIATRRYFRQLAQATADVERFVASDDPIVAGPVPDDPSRRRVWLMVREQRMRPLESALDRLGTMLEDGFVPELEHEDWPRKMIACLTACQRHFDAVVLDGPDNAGNARLAETEWDALRVAAGAFEAASGLSGTGGNPTR